MPALSGKLATLGYLAPRLFRRMRPVLEQLGARNERRFMDRKVARWRYPHGRWACSVQ